MSVSRSFDYFIDAHVGLREVLIQEAMRKAKELAARLQISLPDGSP